MLRNDYAKIPDDQAEFGRKDTVNEKGFYILPSELFQNVQRNASNNKDLNVDLQRIFKILKVVGKGLIVKAM